MKLSQIALGFGVGIVAGGVTAILNTPKSGKNFSKDSNPLLMIRKRGSTN